MKTAAAGGGIGKRRWRGLVIGVLGLVLLSMLVPLLFLLGLHNGFHSTGYMSEQQSSTSTGLEGYSKYNQSEDVLNKSYGDTKNETRVGGATHDSQQKKDILGPPDVVQQPLPKTNPTKGGGTVEITEYMKGVTGESGKTCEVKYGSYCLWHQEHREEMKDSMVKKLKDQLFVARAYYPSIAKLPAQNKLSGELKQNIQELERVLSETTTDADLPPLINKKSERMEIAILKAKSVTVDCNNVDKKLRQIFEMTEDEANFHMKQSAFLYQLAVQTMPKSLHCLSMRLTVEYFRSPSRDTERSLTEKFSDPKLYHYVIFSNNVLASSVVINSTVMHAKESVNQVFHVLTDGQNYFAMKLWFFKNSYKEATVRVLNVEQLNLRYPDNLTSLHLSLPEEFRVSVRSIDNPSAPHIRTEYISTFSHSHYFLPEIFKNLKKVIVLDDDVVVQQDLSALWNLNMEGKVNGAVEFCGVRLGQLKNYLGENSFDKDACAWMSGLNIIDLVKWRELDLTENYHNLVQERLSMGDRSIKAASLRASLLTFQDLIYALDSEWSLSGLGHDYSLDIQALKKAAVLHYNGNMKPWLELGIPKYKDYWKKFLNCEDMFLGKCNVNP